MPEIVIKNELLAPGNIKILQYKGYHPSRALKELPEILKRVLKIVSADLFEDQFKWDRSSDPVSFYAVWRARNNKHDPNSPIWIRIVVDGKQSIKDKNGQVTVKIDGWVETKMSYSNFIHKFLLNASMYFFYNKQIRRYIEMGKIYMERIEDEIRALFNLLKK